MKLMKIKENIKLKSKNILWYFRQGMWQQKIQEKRGKERFFLRFFRTFYLAGKGFIKDQCMFRASSLTYFTLLSIIPIFAMIFGLAKGFGFEKTMEDLLYQNFVGQEEVIEKIIDFSSKMLENTQGGMIAGVGFITLLFSVFKVLHHIETSLNVIWEIEKAKSWFRKFSDSTTILMFAPVMVVISSSLNIFVKGFLKSVMDHVQSIWLFSPLFQYSIRLFPVILIAVILLMIYMLLPNTKVRFSGALLGALVAALLIQALQWFYLTFQIGISQYNAIYGSFAALPLFLFWMQYSWFFVLFGAEVAFSFQNEHFYEYEQQTRSLNLITRRRIAIILMYEICLSFEKGKQCCTASDLSYVCEIPFRAVKIVLYELNNAGLIRIIYDEDKEYYSPAYDIHRISVEEIVEKLDTAGMSSLNLSHNKYYADVVDALEQLKENKLEKNIPIIKKIEERQ